MSTFSGLNTALSGLNAARLALQTSGNNLANVATPGYTRQRVDLQAAGTVASTGRLSSPASAGQGVLVGGIARLADAHLDARVRGTVALAAQTDTRAEAMASLESVLREPGENGLSALLNDFWAGWQDVANAPGEHAPAAVLLERAKAVTGRIAQMSTEITGQWAATRASVDTMVSDINAAATSVAALNEQIRSVIAAGNTPNALLDQREVLTGQLAELAGASVRQQGDGTVDVLVDGNALVLGVTARPLQVTGAPVLANADQSPIVVSWAHRPTEAIGLQSGRLAGALSVLAPSDADGTGGPLAEAATTLDQLAAGLAQSVNALQRQGKTPGGQPGKDFFDFNPLHPAATLRVAELAAGDLATAGAKGGALDGSNALLIADLATAPGGPNEAWTQLVVGIASRSRQEAQQAVAGAVAAAGAVSARQSASAVSIDEENVALVANQHAFQASARVMSAVDEMLDTLINRTGLVGR